MRCARAAAAVALAAALGVSACSAGGDDPGGAGGTTSSAPPSAAPAPSSPERYACYRMTYDEAIAPTSTARPVSCESPHTARTFAVGRLTNLVDGHLLAVDSARVQRQVAGICADRFAGYIGGSEADRRLSMLRPVWFTPTVAESDAGAEWFRCDVIALAAEEELMPLEGRLIDVLSTRDGRDRFGMCSPAAPDAPGFTHVTCTGSDAWRAVAAVDLEQALGGRYPGADVVRQRGQAPCEDAGAAAGGDDLSYEWGYEAPTREQWDAGQTYGRCWVPAEG